MIWPGRPADKIKIIDVRDFANFTVDCAERRVAGIYNAATPAGSYSMGDLLRDCEAVSATDVEAIWVDEAFVRKAESLNTERNRGLVPIWNPVRGEDAEPAQISVTRARAAGLHNRPVRETARDLLTWWRTLPETRTANPGAGMSVEFEAELIALWKEQKS